MQLAMAPRDEDELRSAMADVASYLTFCVAELQGIQPGGVLTPEELASLRQNRRSVCERRSPSERARFDAMMRASIAVDYEPEPEPETGATAAEPPEQDASRSGPAFEDAVAGFMYMHHLELDPSAWRERVDESLRSGGDPS